MAVLPDREKVKQYELRYRAFILAAHGIARAPAPEYTDLDAKVLLWLSQEMETAMKAVRGLA